MHFLLVFCVTISKWPSLLRLQSLAYKTNQVIMPAVVGVLVGLRINLLTYILVCVSTQQILPFNLYQALRALLLSTAAALCKHNSE